MLKVAGLAKTELGEILSSCEMMDKLSVEASTKNLGLKCPLSGDSHEFYMLIETAGSNQSHDEEKLSSFVEKAMSRNLISDGTLNSEPGKIKVRTETRVDNLKTFYLFLIIEKTRSEKFGKKKNLIIVFVCVEYVGSERTRR